MRIDLSCPVENRGVTVKTNSTTNEPYALFRLFNLSEKTVEGVKFIARAYDAYGKELGSVPVELSELDGQPKSPFAVNKGVSLADFSDAKHVTADICEVTFSDGETYTVAEENMTEVNYIQPEYDEVTRLKEAAGSDAACYAQDPGAYWLCVCGRPNREADDACIRCGRNRQTVLAKFSSHDKITKALEEKHLAEEAAELERLAEAERQRAEKQQRLTKRLFAALISVLCVAVLAVIVLLSYRAIATKIADGKAAKGKYMEAYELYRRAGSSHIGNVSEKVKGNSFSNLIQSGILTADEENIYYVTNTLHIMKKNKTTGNAVQLGEAQGVSLNVSGDWVYYTNPASGEVCRIKTDGSITESVTEEQVSFFMTIGNDLYYIAADSDAAKDTQQNAASQQQTPIALYCMNTESKKVKKVSNAQFYSLEFYKGKIYYVDGAQEQKLCVMDLNGKHARTLIDRSVYGYSIVNDVIYYIDSGTEEGASMPALTMKSVQLDGSGEETLVSDKTIALVNAQEDGIYFVSYDDQKLYRYDTESKQSEEIPIEAFNICNIADGYLAYMTQSSEIILAKTDGSKEQNMGALDTSSLIAAN